VKYNNIRWWVILLTVLCVVAGQFSTDGISAQADTAVDISPASQTVTAGQVFTVDVVVNPGVAIAGVEFALSFDPSLLTADSVAEGNLLNQNGDPTFFLTGTIDSGNGAITGVAGAILGAGATVSSPGTFATITFTAKTTAGISLLDLSNVTVGDVNGDPVPIVVTDGSVTIEIDTTPPVISGVQAINITSTSATIIWTTDDAADSVVNYGNTTALGSTASDSALVTDHAIGLTNLAPATLYYYEVRSTNAGGLTRVDNNGGAYYTFTTTATPDTTPPVISGVQAIDITLTSATIIWTTDEPADSVVNYGNTTALVHTASDARLVTSHMVSLGGLDPETTYYYEVQSTDGAGNPASDNNGGLYYTFITTYTTPPTITGVQAIPITATSAVVTWATDSPATSVVNYGNSTALGLTASDASLVTSHSITLNGLLQGITYYYEVQSTGAGGNTTDNNEGAYYTLTIYRLTGWGWCTDYTEIANAEFVANGFLVPRDDALESSDIRLMGNVTLTLSDATTESIALDIYGTKVRSLFYGNQEEEGISASLNGVWLTWDGGQYLSALGRITLPHGEIFKTAKFYLLQLRTPGVEIPDKEQDGFAADLDYIITEFTKFIDGLIDKLMVSDFADILGEVLAKVMILLAAVRELGIPYIS